MLKQLLTTSDVAEILGVAEATLHQWSYRHTGPPVARIGGFLRYDPEELATWIESRKSHGGPNVPAA